MPAKAYNLRRSFELLDIVTFERNGMPYFGTVKVTLKGGKIPNDHSTLKKASYYGMDGKPRTLPYPGESLVIRIDKNQPGDMEWWWLPVYEVRPVYTRDLPGAK